jgi:urease accessory protein
MPERLALSRLLQLASPLLPVGAYSYSQGLEWAIEDGTVKDAVTAERWIADVLELYLCKFELPLLQRLCVAWAAHDEAALAHWHAVFYSGRDTAEARAETLQMGYSLVKLLQQLDGFSPELLARLKQHPAIGFPLAYACAVCTWQIPVNDALHAYVWSWAENQVSAAMKAVPLGQVAGQRMLLALGEKIPAALEMACRLQDDELSNFAPGLAMAGCKHEMQYSRIFRS